MDIQPQNTLETQNEPLQIHKSSNTKLLVGVAILLVALIVIVSVFGSLLLFNKQTGVNVLPPSDPGVMDAKQTTTPPEVSVFKQERSSDSDSSQTPAAPEQEPPVAGDFPGYVPKETLCYSLFIPMNHNAGEDNSCLQYISTNQAYPFSVNITLAVVQDGATPEQMANKFIANTLKTSPTVTFEEEAIKLGGVDAMKVIEGNAVNLVKSVHIFVLAPKEYNVSGFPARNFQLMTVQDGYLDPELQLGQQQDLATLIASWQWK